jgi:tRNA(Arg) A34 adenosine deaminase TadA
MEEVSMSWDEIRSLGQGRLRNLGPGAGSIEAWKTYLLEYQPQVGHPDDAPVWLTCALALEAVATGNFGVGAILLDEAGHVAALGHNQVFAPHFRSDRHAEMVVLDDWEDTRPGRPEGSGFTLYTSVEPCPMCLVRLSTSAVGQILFAAQDLPGGMVHRMTDLPPFWSELARRKTFAPARCSEQLARGAGQIFLLNLEDLTARIGRDSILLPASPG